MGRYDDYDGYRPEDDCMHDDYEADVNGRATCCRCSYSWWLTAEEIENERKLQVTYDEMMRREERRERIQRMLDTITWPFLRRRRKPVEIDDDIPF